METDINEQKDTVDNQATPTPAKNTVTYATMDNLKKIQPKSGRYKMFN